VSSGLAPSAAAASGLPGLISAKIRDIRDYPQPGIVFKDITPLLADGDAFAAVVDAMAEGFREGAGIDKVVGIEARGFILAAPVAYRMRAGFVPVRKQGKLPAETLGESYELEYGTATVEVHVDAFRPGERVLIVDDVLATGGTAAASVSLVRRSGAEVAAVSVLLELGFLGGRARLPGVEVRSASRAARRRTRHGSPADRLVASADVRSVCGR
jgi:adenine phosphoribosyltransferase